MTTTFWVEKGKKVAALAQELMPLDPEDVPPLVEEIRGTQFGLELLKADPEVPDGAKERADEYLDYLDGICDYLNEVVAK